eukprot:maker-scaffold384_size188899-snap-gene-0.32 protein:Tk06451 transcript:maker-scaffold384_size188899-snap-gene-0.32-mRNA-1 annotation:"hypothetical protein"
MVAEHWERILAGVMGGSVAMALIFYVFDRLLKIRNAQRNLPSGPVAGVPLVFRGGSGMSHAQMGRSDMERLIYEEYKTEAHEIVMATAETTERAVALCVFLADMRVEYYCQIFPECCVSHSEEFTLRNLVAAINLWGPGWLGADPVTILCQNRDMVLQVNDQVENRLKGLFEQYADKFEFGLNFQLGDNFFCPDIDGREVWESANITVQRLLSARTEDEEDFAWHDFVLEHWERTRISQDLTDKFHFVPHPGPISLEADDPEQKLIELD